MKSRWVIAPALLTLAMAAHADDAAVKKALQAKYDAFVKAFIAKDVATIEKMGAPGFTSNGPDGKVMDAKASLAMLKKEVQQTPPGATGKFTVTSVSVKGDKATATTKGVMSMKQMGQDKKMHTMVMESTSQDKWVKIGGDWKILAYREKPGSMTMDGKKMDMGAMGGGAPAGGKKK